VYRSQRRRPKEQVASKKSGHGRAFDVESRGAITMTDDEFIEVVESFPFDDGPMTLERGPRGLTLIHVETRTPIALLRPTKGYKEVFDVFYRSADDDWWISAKDFGGDANLLGEAIRLVADIPIFWAALRSEDL
jgi:hypothetical protein